MDPAHRGHPYQAPRSGSVYTVSLSAQNSNSANYYNIWINDATPNWWDVNASRTTASSQYSMGNTGSSC